MIYLLALALAGLVAPPGCCCGPGCECTPADHCGCHQYVQAVPDPVPAPMNYATAYQLALDVDRPLIVFVGLATRPVPRCLVCYVAAFPGTGPGSIVVGVPSVGTLVRGDLPGSASTAEVLALAERLGGAAAPAITWQGGSTGYAGSVSECGPGGCGPGGCGASSGGSGRGVGRRR